MTNATRTFFNPNPNKKPVEIQRWEKLVPQTMQDTLKKNFSIENFTSKPYYTVMTSRSTSLAQTGTNFLNATAKYDKLPNSETTVSLRNYGFKPDFQFTDITGISPVVSKENPFVRKVLFNSNEEYKNVDDSRGGDYWIVGIFGENYDTIIVLSQVYIFGIPTGPALIYVLTQQDPAEFYKNECLVNDIYFYITSKDGNVAKDCPDPVDLFPLNRTFNGFFSVPIPTAYYELRTEPNKYAVGDEFVGKEDGKIYKITDVNNRRHPRVGENVRVGGTAITGRIVSITASGKAKVSIKGPTGKQAIFETDSKSLGSTDMKSNDANSVSYFFERDDGNNKKTYFNIFENYVYRWNFKIPRNLENFF